MRRAAGLHAFLPHRTATNHGMHTDHGIPYGPAAEGLEGIPDTVAGMELFELSEEPQKAKIGRSSPSRLVGPPTMVGKDIAAGSL